MTEINTEFKYHRTCKLGKIKECSVSFDTNIKSKLFCCDSHRYRWHNNLKTLFRRMTKLEDSFEDVKKAFSRIGEAITESIVSSETFKNTLKKMEKILKEKK